MSLRLELKKYNTKKNIHWLQKKIVILKIVSIAPRANLERA